MTGMRLSKKWVMSRVGMLLLVLLLTSMESAQAGLVIAIDGVWQSYYWYGAPGAWWASGGGPFTYTAATWTSLKVTDYHDPLDRFDVYDWGSRLGTTSLASGAPVWTVDPDVAYGSPDWSWGEFFLPPGPHSITIQTIAVGSHSDGIGALRVDTSGPQPIPAPGVVPLPGAALLAMIGVSMAGWLGRREIL